jgi:hypothetical protein
MFENVVTGGQLARELEQDGWTVTSYATGKRIVARQSKPSEPVKEIVLKECPQRTGFTIACRHRVYSSGESGRIERQEVDNWGAVGEWITSLAL